MADSRFPGIDFGAVKAIVFDCFDTLLQITDKQHPYKALFSLIARKGRPITHEEQRTVMRSSVGLSATPGLFGIDVSAAELEPIEEQLLQELLSIEPFPDVGICLGLIQFSGYKIAICSNLAKPYAVPAKALLLNANAHVWSFETGHLKPEPGIFQSVCTALECLPGEILMIGDSLKYDVEGARAFGFQALWLDRLGKSPEAIHDLYQLTRLLPRIASGENRLEESAHEPGEARGFFDPNRLDQPEK